MFSLSPTPLALLAVIVLDSKPVFNLSPRQVGRSSVLPLRRPASIQSVWIFYQQAGKETRERASKDPVLDVSLTGIGLPMWEKDLIADRDGHCCSTTGREISLRPFTQFLQWTTWRLSRGLWNANFPVSL